jgi:hypothetical protein
MKGRQLVSLKKNQKNRGLSYLESPIGFIKGISEELHSLSPKERQHRNQIYLKSISPVQIRAENHDSQDISLLKSINPVSESTSNSLLLSFPRPKHEKIFRYNPDSKFSIHFHTKEAKILSKLTNELFPEELNEHIEYLPDYSPSIIHQRFPLEATHRSSSSQAAPDSWKISTLYKSKRPKNMINASNLKNSSFSTYTTGWELLYSGRSTLNSFRKTKVDYSHFLPRV